MTYHTRMRHETKIRLQESRTHTQYECERKWIQDDSKTYHTRMRHQVKIQLELDVADSPRPVMNSRMNTQWECLWKWIHTQVDDLSQKNVTSKKDHAKRIMNAYAIWVSNKMNKEQLENLPHKDATLSKDPVRNRRGANQERTCNMSIKPNKQRPIRKLTTERCDAE